MDKLKKVGFQILGFLRTHMTRLISGALILAGCLFLTLGRPYPMLWWLVLMIPPLLGAAVPALSLSKVSGLINRRDESFDRGIQAAREKGTKISRFFARPLHWCGAFIWRVTSRLSSEHVRAAVRATAAIYIAAIVIALISAAAIVFLWLAVAGVVLWIGLWVLGGGLSESSKSSSTSSAPSHKSTSIPAVSGRFYRGSGWLTEELEGRVDEEGNIYRGSSWISEERIGRVDDEGRIYRGTSFLNEEIVGRIDEDGRIYRGSNWFNEERAGRVTEDGQVLEGDSWLNEQRVGRIDKN